MSSPHIIVLAAGLQAFEQGSPASQPFTDAGAWQEDVPQRIELPDDAPSLPWELAYARACGLPSDGISPAWAAFETRTLQTPCAWVHLCHLDVGMTDMVMQPVELLGLTQQESHELWTLLSPYFEQDRIALREHEPGRWLAQAEVFGNLPCASLARVQGRSINAFLPDAGASPELTRLARLQAEVQMLLYEHPINEARTRKGLPAVNSFWIDGAGSLPALPAAPSTAIQLERRLQQAAHDPTAYRQAWQALSTQWDSQAAQALAQGQPMHITLCGEQRAARFAAVSVGWKHKLRSFLGSQPSPNIRTML